METEERLEELFASYYEMIRKPAWYSNGEEITENAQKIEESLKTLFTPLESLSVFLFWNTHNPLNSHTEIISPSEADSYKNEYSQYDTRFEIPGLSFKGTRIFIENVRFHNKETNHYVNSGDSKYPLYIFMWKELQLSDQEIEELINKAYFVII